MTCRSCIASSNAACVLGGVRLISSARIMLREQRTFQETPLAGPRRAVLLDDLRAGDVRRHQVGRELNAAEGQVQRPRQRADHQRLGQPGHAFQQAVPAAEQRDQQFFDHLLLADDHLGQLLRIFSRASPSLRMAADSKCPLSDAWLDMPSSSSCRFELRLNTVIAL